jgi:anti-anti-sigma factor
MRIQEQPGNIILLSLAWSHCQPNQLGTVMAMVRRRRDCSVVVDFSCVDVAGCATLARLLELRQLLQDRGDRLILCGVAPAIMGIFAVSRLDAVFHFIADKCAALAHLQSGGGNR